MKQVIASDKQRLDEIVYKEYGTLEFMEIVLDHNPHLTSKLVLNTKDVVNIPIIKKKKDEEKEDALW